VVTQANTYINQIAVLNGQIRALTAVGDNPNTYLDERDYAIDQLSQILPTSTSLQSNGSAFVSVAGRPLVDDTVAYNISGPVIEQSTNGTPTMVFGFANDPDPSNPAPIPVSGGQLGGFADLYNNKLAPYGQQLDNVASSAATEMNRITEAGVDLNGNAGTALFTPGNLTAATISVAITDPKQLPLGLISTTAGNLTQAMNSANSTVSTSTQIDGNVTLFNPPASVGITGTLSIAVDGITPSVGPPPHQTFTYNTAAGGNADTIADFMTNFNAGHFGVTVTYDATSQTIGFTRDPNNIDAVHRGLQGSLAPTDSFTISDSLGPVGTTPPSAPSAANSQGTATGGQGTPAIGLLQALGATNINGVAQTALNAFGSADNGDANAMTTLFTKNVGVGALQTSAYSAVVSGGGLYLATISPPAGNPGLYTSSLLSSVAPNNSVTIIDAATGTSQTDTVTSVNALTGTITVSSTAPISLNDSINVSTTTSVGSVSPAPSTVLAVSSASGSVTLTPATALATIHVGDSVSIGGNTDVVTATVGGTITVNSTAPISAGQPISFGSVSTTVAAISTATGSVTIAPPFATAFAAIQVGDALSIGGTTDSVTAVNSTTGTITVNSTALISAGQPISLVSGAQTLTPPASYQSAFVAVNVGALVTIAGNVDVVTAVDRTAGTISVAVNAGLLVTAGASITLPDTGVGNVSTGAPYTVTIAQPPGSPGAFATVNVGQLLTIVNASSGTQQSVPVTAVNRNTGTITVSASEPINPGDPITTTQSQTIGAAYGSLVTEMGLDMSTATTGLSTQTALSSSIDQARQAVDGINVDEETQNLIKFQAAYTAAAKTFTTLNTMMQTTLNLIAGG
jgi:flagellar hook-associated protein FlgK